MKKYKPLPDDIAELVRQTAKPSSLDKPVNPDPYADPVLDNIMKEIDARRALRKDRKTSQEDK